MDRTPELRAATLDALVIGAGVSGLVQLHRLRQLGLAALALEAGSDVGGTWYWNRYPGARFDSESYTYGYAFSQELLDEWEWSEHFSAQPETLRYLQHVADRFELRRHIRFDSRVTAARWDEGARRWEVATDDGFVCRPRWLITAIGALSEPTLPRIDGREDFAGAAFHTARWPREGFAVAGLRVGVIGTGATGVQLVPEVAKTAGRLTVFQRSPNWCAPLHNAPIDPEARRRIKATQSELLRRCNETFGGFLHDAEPLKTSDVSPAEREAFWEKRYAEPGFGIWFANYRDVLVDPAANRLLSDFIARKIHERVHDPALADRLVPKDHGFGTRRVPLETGYYEVYNQANVELVDLRETPIVRITPRGIRTTAGEHALDLIVYATGFDAVTGAFDRIDVRGVGGRALRAAWADGPVTLLGLQTPGFPNLFTLVGPHNVSTFCNMPRCIEQNVDWVSACLAHLSEAGATRIEASESAAAAWTQHVHESASRLLLSRVDSWFTGVNRNLPGKKRVPLIYAGGLPLYRERSNEIAAGGYAGFVIAGAPRQG
jgi:cation diffusion facilitator CzcD-associated flavoprotein CzcO